VVASALRLAEGAPVIHLTRLRLVEGTPLLAEDIWLPRQRFAPLLELENSAFGDLLYPLYDERCGQVVVSAEETLTVEPASAADARLLRRDDNAPLIVIERLAFDLERAPIEWRRSRGPADTFRYHVEIR
jgi:GntR family transcriptional regulator